MDSLGVHEYHRTHGDVALVMGLLCGLIGVGLLWWAVLSFRDRELRPGIVCTVFGVVLVASGLSLGGVF